MKKVLLATGLLGLAVIAATGVIVLRSNAAKEAPVQNTVDVSPKSAALLQTKIDSVKKAEEDSSRKDGASRFEITEAELESYVLYSLKEDIPARVDTIDVQLSPGAVAADTQITFTSDATGNPMVDALVGGTHNLFLKGKLTGSDKRGKFDLEEIRVDGIPVPKVLIQTLFKKYVKPKYPEADLNAPFDLPWGIEDLKLETGKATVVY